MNTAYISAYETCPSCDGCGLGLNAYNGEPDDCWTCKGYGTIRARDANGRFIGNVTKMTKIDKLEEFYPDLGDMLVGALLRANLAEPLDSLDMDEAMKTRLREAGF